MQLFMGFFLSISALQRKKKEMDFYFDDLPSTSQSTPKKAQDDTQMVRCENDLTKRSGVKDLFLRLPLILN